VQLQQLLATHQIAATARQLQQLTSFITMLAKWNRVFNLVAKTNNQSPDALLEHLADCLAILPKLPHKDMVDIGSGGGFPGLIIAILRADSRIVLVDSNGKKTRFLQHCINQLLLQNVTVINSRVQQYQPKNKFCVLVSRAYSSIPNLVQDSSHLLVPNGRIFAMVSTFETSTAMPYTDLKVHTITVPHKQLRQLVELKID